jgi:hypothetical protein
VTPLILLLIKEILLPEVVAYVKAKQAAGQPISEAELYAEFEARISRIITAGESWLAAHPE